MNVVLHDHNLFLNLSWVQYKVKRGLGGSVFTFPVQTYISKMLFSLDNTVEAYKIKKPELHS